MPLDNYHLSYSTGTLFTWVAVFGEGALVQPTAVCQEFDLTASHEAAFEVAEPGWRREKGGMGGGRREGGEEGEGRDGRREGRRGRGRREGGEEGGEEGRKRHKMVKRRREKIMSSHWLWKCWWREWSGETFCFVVSLREGRRQMMSQTLTSSIRLAGVTSRSFSELCCASPTFSTSAINSPTSCFRRWYRCINVSGSLEVSS